MVGCIEIVNRTDRLLRIRNVTSGCGCTAIRQIDPDVAPGESTRLLVRIEQTDYGDFKIGMQFMAAGQPRVLHLQGKTALPLHPSETPLRIGTEGTGELKLELRDRTLVPESLRFHPLGKGFRVQRGGATGETVTLRIEHTNTARLPSHFYLVPQAGRRTLPRIDLPVVFIGRIRVVPEEAYVRKTDEVVRLFLAGDVPRSGAIAGQLTATNVDAPEDQVRLKSSIKPAVSEPRVRDGDAVESSNRYEIANPFQGLNGLRYHVRFERPALPPIQFFVNLRD